MDKPARRSRPTEEMELVVLDGTPETPPVTPPEVTGPIVVAKPEPSRKARQALHARLDLKGVQLIRDHLPLWTMRWTEAGLRKMYATMGAREFNRGFRQMVMSDTDLLFDTEAVDESLDRSLILPDRVPEHLLTWRRDAGVDLATGKDVEHAAFVVAGIATEKLTEQSQVVALERHKGLSMGQQIGVIKALHHRLRFDCVTVESNNFQAMMTNHFKFDEEELIPAQAYYTSGETKVDIALGIPALAIEFEHRRWKIPYGNAHARRVMEPLIEELRLYPTPGPTYDCLDALFFAREGRRRAFASAFQSAPSIDIIDVR